MSTRRVIITTQSEVFWGGVFTCIMWMAIGVYALMIAFCLMGIYLLFTEPKTVFWVLVCGGIILAFTHHPAISGGVVAFVFLVAILTRKKRKSKRLLIQAAT